MIHRKQIFVSAIGWFQTLAGGILASFFALGFLMSIFSDSYIFNDSLTFLIPALLLGFMVYCGRKRLKAVKMYGKYKYILGTKRHQTIQEIASALNASFDFTKAEVKILVKYNLLVNTYLNEKYNTLVNLSIPEDMDERDHNHHESSHDESQSSRISGYAKASSKQYVNVACKGCGAINKVLKSSSAECEFCGSAIDS